MEDLATEDSCPATSGSSTAAPAASTPIKDDWPPDVTVVGGGLAGLLAALRLAEAGCRVTLIESEPWLGGKVVGFIDESGEAREHSMRVYMGHYRTLLGVLDRVEACEGGRSARQSLSPVHMDYLPTPHSTPLRALDLFKHCGVSSDIVSFGAAITHSHMLAKNHTMNMDEWFSHYKISPAVVKFANSVMGVWTGAKPRSRASSILGSLFIVLLSMFSPPGQASWKEKAFRFAALGGATNQLYMAYPTSRATVEPIRRRLEDLGVEFRTGVRVTSLRTAPAPPSSYDSHEDDSRGPIARVIELGLMDERTGAELPSVIGPDAVVLAVDTASAGKLYPAAFTANPPQGSDAGAAADEASGEWSVGCNFPVANVKDLPDFLRTPHPAPRMVLDSPWHIVYCVVPRSSFVDVAGAGFAADGMIFVTASNFEDAPGRLFGKPALLCTPTELKLEYLEQIGLSGTPLAASLAEGGSPGIGMEFVSRAELEDRPWKYKSCALGPEIPNDPEGHRWASRSLLYIETKDSADVGIIAPGCENLFLAGEYISSRYTTIKVPTMEKSAETGAMAAWEALRWLSQVKCAQDQSLEGLLAPEHHES